MRPIAQAAIRIVFVLVTAVAGVAAAQEPATPSAMERATAKAAAVRGIAEGGEAASMAAPPTSAIPDKPSDAVLSDPATRQKYLNAMQRYYEYRANGYEYRSRVFEWQLLSSRFIFLIVLLLVAAGVYFAAVQFHVALAAARRAAAHAATAADAEKAIDSALRTQLEVSAKGVVVNSSVLGVIILALSLAFFYLYLVYVYPIQNVI